MWEKNSQWRPQGCRIKHWWTSLSYLILWSISMLCDQKIQGKFDRHGASHPSLNFQEENRVYQLPRCAVPEWIILSHMFSFEESPKLYCPLSNLGWKYRTHQTQLGSRWHFKQPSNNNLTVMRTCLWGNFPSNSKVWRAASYKEYVDMIKLVRRRGGGAS